MVAVLQATAHCEAYLDFGEDDDIGESTLANGIFRFIVRVRPSAA